MVYRKAKPQGTLLKEFREHVTKGASPSQFIDDVLIPMAHVFEEISDAAYSSVGSAEKVNEHLRWLNRLEFNDWIPPALSFAVRSRDQEEMRRFFADLERLSYAMLINRWGINERIERYSRLTLAVERREDLWQSDSPLQMARDEQYETYKVLDGPIYEGLAARARSAVLLRLDSLLSAGGATYDYATVTVEHVLPQNPPDQSEWITWFPDAAIRSQLVHRLGNLALLTRKKNSAASNFDFRRKKATYFSQNGISPFVLTTEVLQHDRWTPEVVEARQTRLLKILEAHWRLGDRKSSLEILLEKAPYSAASVSI